MRGGRRRSSNINGSPFHRGKADERVEICRARARQTGAWIVYVNAVGGQDELVFDGGSVVVRPDGSLAHHAAMFEEDLLVVDIDGETSSAKERPPWPEDPEQVYLGLVLGLRDYVRKNGFGEVVARLSGGIDSTFRGRPREGRARRGFRPCALRCPPLSPRPRASRTQAGRRRARDASRRARDRGRFAAHLEPFAERRVGKTGSPENLQARIRGNLLMAISNLFGSLVLATGNKSEYAVGYATLYGDMAGGFAPIKDVPKTLVYELARWRNAVDAAEPPPIPRQVLDKPPSAELRPHQKDTDTLPRYEVLDPIVEAYVEDDRAPEDIIAERGLDPRLVDRVVEMIDRAEYKRRQAPPGVKLRPKAFGRDRRLPITNRWRG